MGSDGESDGEDARSNTEDEEASQVSTTPGARSSQRGSRRNAGSGDDSRPSSRADSHIRRSNSVSPGPQESDRDGAASEPASEREGQSALKGLDWKQRVSC